MAEQLGVIGLGRMGGNLALQALDEGMHVVGYAPSPSEELVAAGLEPAADIAELSSKLTPPRAIFLYVPAGTVIDEVIAELEPTLDEGDVIVDGGNSYWGNSIERQRRLASQGVHFVDLGTSGGVEGARNGACFMAGGEPEAVARVEPILRALAVEGGYIHAGPPGSGHFAKLVHNGIEFGMLQAIGEGIDLLEHYEAESADLDVPALLETWMHGSVIRSWLIELMAQGYRQQRGLADVPPYVEDTGEVNWLVSDAMEMERPIPVIAQAVMQLFASRDQQGDWARAIAVMRHGFGGHPFGPDEGVRRYRGSSRVPLAAKDPTGERTSEVTEAASGRPR